MTRDRGGVPLRLLLTLAAGTILNPLNSSMIAVALVSLQHDFAVGIATSTWLAAGFYVAASVGQPLMGRLADRFGARRLFIAGLVLMGVVSAAAPFATAFGWLLAFRVLQAVATSTAFPCALILIRSVAGGSRPPAGALATITVANSLSAALGPVLGGLLIALAGWEAVFLVNVPIAVVGAIVAVRVLPPDTPADDRDGGPAPRASSLWREMDVPGTLLFAVALSTLIMLVLSFAAEPTWWLLPVVVVASVMLVRRELRVTDPFLDVRGLASGPGLRTVLAQQGGVNLVFYCVFFGLPQWLEHVRGFAPSTVGLIVLPITVLSLVVVPLTTRSIRRRGSAWTVIAGLVTLLIATAAIQFLGDDTTVVALIAIALLLGVPNGITNLALQTALYENAPPDRVGASAGLFQTFRYLGAISATTILGLILENDLSTDGLHRVGAVMTGVAVLLLALALHRARAGGTSP